MKRHQIGYGVALLVGLAVAGLGTGALAQSAGKSASDTVTATVTAPGSTDMVTTTAPGTTTTVTTTAPPATTTAPTTTANDDNNAEDVPGPCDEAEHANDPQCTGVGAVNPAADNDDQAENENEANHQNRGKDGNGQGESGQGEGGRDGVRAGVRGVEPERRGRAGGQ